MSDETPETPVDSPPTQADLDRPWRIWASVIVGGAIAAGAVLGLVLIPAGQRSHSHLSMHSAMSRAMGLSEGSPARVQPISTATAYPVSQVSWDPAVMAILRAGSTTRGAQIAKENCSACHGNNGVSAGNFPSLAGQSPEAVYKQLSDFRSGARVNVQMSPVAQKLSVADLANVAAYFAAASREYSALGSRDLSGDTATVTLAREGDSHRRIPACLACHVNGSGGPIETPVITGQSADYLLRQLNDYAAGTRHNDVYGRMRDVSSKLTPAERDRMARYFEGTL